MANDDGNEIELSCEQAEKLLVSIVVTVEGIEIADKVIQPEKLPTPRLYKPSERVIEESDEQPAKALSPILVIAYVLPSWINVFPILRLPE